MQSKEIQTIQPELRKLPEESEKQYQAFLDYVNLGSARSLSKLAGMYERQQQQKETIPPVSPTTLKSLSLRFSWVSRARAFDQSALDALQEAQAVTRRETFSTGLALDYNRVKYLQGLLRKIEQNGGLNSAAMIAQVRGILSDIAQETGGRGNTSLHYHEGAKTTVQVIKIGDREISF